MFFCVTISYDQTYVMTCCTKWSSGCYRHFKTEEGKKKNVMNKRRCTAPSDHQSANKDVLFIGSRKINGGINISLHTVVCRLPAAIRDRRGGAGVSLSQSLSVIVVALRHAIQQCRSHITLSWRNLYYYFLKTIKINTIQNPM